MNILIPLNGSGRRFTEEGYSAPKPLIKIQGKPMIYWVIESLKIDIDDQIVIVYNSALDSYNFCSMLQNQFNAIDFKFIPLKYETRGAAETILCGLNNMTSSELDNSCMLVDCDTIYFDDIVQKYKKKEGNAIFYFQDNDDKPIYSYIKINEAGKVLDIKEKEKISNNANTGTYCFNSGTILKTYCQKLLNSGDRSKNEFYISGVYKKMINDGISVHSHLVDDFYCVGTPIQLQWFASVVGYGDRQRICFDIDNTLLTYPRVKGDYSTCEPIPEAVRFLKFVKSMGNEIILYTARRMKTHHGNVGKVVSDIGQTTIESLEKYGIPYDEIYFGKPYAHCYIDDMSVNPKLSLEKQLGFYKTEIEPREFHNIEQTEHTVTKRGELSGEAYWYKHLPVELSCLVPKVHTIKSDQLVMERISGISLSYLYVNNSLTIHNLESLLQSLEKLHEFDTEPAAAFKARKGLYDNYDLKLSRRYCEYDYSTFSDSYQTYKKIHNKLAEYRKRDLAIPGIIHGDPVFTNVLLDTTNNIKLIDPRGKLGDNETIYGDIFYDYAKIYQSLLGYDFILLEKEFNERYMQEMIQYLEEHIKDKYGIKRLTAVKLITASMLFSLIPLHDNNKCEKYYGLINERRLV
ncbi:hypothetical protein CMI47_23290 [Candidatus Pacearchaeota archaeon]|nr:hypothetical protein [Candidatus Pacearchaeota archaeon]